MCYIEGNYSKKDKIELTNKSPFYKCVDLKYPSISHLICCWIRRNRKRKADFNKTVIIYSSEQRYRLLFTLKMILAKYLDPCIRKSTLIIGSRLTKVKSALNRTMFETVDCKRKSSGNVGAVKGNILKTIMLKLWKRLYIIALICFFLDTPILITFLFRF